MLLPMGGGGMSGDAPPTEWALSMRKWCIVLWVLLFLLFIAKLVVLDFFGGFSMLFVIGLGYFVPWGKPAMQQRWIIMWGIICAFNAMIDLIFGIMHLVQYLNGTYAIYYSKQYSGGHHGYHDPHAVQTATPAPTPLEKYMMEVALYAVIIGLLVPVVEIIAAWLCYRLYKEHPRTDSDYESSYGGVYGGGGSYGSTGGYGGGSVYQQGRGPAGGRPSAGPRGPGFTAFQGGGQRLGGR